MNLLEESKSMSNDNDNNDDQWEYMEEGTLEITWHGNKIIFNKNKVTVRASNKEPNQNQVMIAFFYYSSNFFAHYH